MDLRAGIPVKKGTSVIKTVIKTQTEPGYEKPAMHQKEWAWPVLYTCGFGRVPADMYD